MKFLLPKYLAAKTALSLLCLFMAATTSQAQINLALTAATVDHAPAATSGLNSTGYGPSNYNDNIISTYTSCPGTAPTPWGWVNTPSTGNYIEYTWTAAQNISKVKFWMADRPMVGCTIQYWNGTAYVTIMQYTNVSCAVDSAVFLPVSTTKLRLFNVLTNTAIFTNSYNANFREIQVFGTGVLPPTVTANTNPLCSGATLVLTASSPTTGATFGWTGPGSFTATGSTVTITNITTAQAGVYSVKAYVGADSSGPTTINIVVNQTPQGVTATSNSPICIGNTLNLTGNSTTPGVSYTWTGPGSFTSATQNPSIATTTAATAGTYTVTASLAGCNGTGSTTVVVNPKPTIATVTGTNPTVCFGSNGTIVITGLNPSSVYTLTYTKNGNPVGPVTFTTNASGSYTLGGLTIGTYANIIATSAAGCASDPAGPVVLVQPMVVPTPTVNNNGPICAGATLNLTATTTPGSTYSWTGPSFTSSTQNPSIPNAQAANAGTYSVIATFQGCISNPGTTTVVVHPLPTATITAAGSTNICAGSTVTLSASTASGQSYSWRLNTVAITGANASSYNAGGAGSYTCRITSSFGCVSISNALVVNVKSVPVPTVSHTGPLSFCEGNSVLLTGSQDPNSPTFQWYKNTTAINGATTTTYSVFQSGTYTYRITNDYGCTGLSAGTTVTVFPVLSPIISRNGGTLSTTAFSSYQWYFNNVAVAGATGPSISFGQNGYYQVECTDANGCTSKSALAWIQDLDVNSIGVNTSDIKLYPNPASDIVHIDAPITVNISIRDMQGQAVLNKDNATEVNISSLANGVYSILLTTKDGVMIKTERLIKMAH
jgi:sarcosine oxidase gamma subunit